MIVQEALPALKGCMSLFVKLNVPVDFLSPPGSIDSRQKELRLSAPEIGPSGFLVAQGPPDHLGLRGADAVQFPGGVEKLSAGVAVHLGDVGGEPERDSLGLL